MNGFGIIFSRCTSMSDIGFSNTTFKDPDATSSS